MAILIVLLLILTVILMIIDWYRHLPKLTSKFSYTKEEDIEVLDLPKTQEEELTEIVDKFLTEGAKEKGITVEEYMDIIVKEEEARKAKMKEVFGDLVILSSSSSSNGL